MNLTENGAYYIISTNKTPFRKLKFNIKVAFLTIYVHPRQKLKA